MYRSILLQQKKNFVFILLFFVVQKCWVSFSGSVYKEKNKPTKSMGLFFLSNSNCYMALHGHVRVKKFQMVSEIIILLLLGFSSKLESEKAKKIYECCPWKQRTR